MIFPLKWNTFAFFKEKSVFFIFFHFILIFILKHAVNRRFECIFYELCFLLFFRNFSSFTCKTLTILTNYVFFFHLFTFPMFFSISQMRNRFSEDYWETFPFKIKKLSHDYIKWNSHLRVSYNSNSIYDIFCLKLNLLNENVKTCIYSNRIYCDEEIPAIKKHGFFFYHIPLTLQSW